MPLDFSKIRKLMGEKSQSELAAAMGMAQPNVARILAGKFDPKLSTVERLASALGVKAKDILNQGKVNHGNYHGNRNRPRRQGSRSV